MRTYKIIGYKFPVKMHAELKARLKYDEIPMTKFIRSYVLAYLENDPLVLDFIKKFKEKNSIQNKIKREVAIKNINKGKELKSVFNLEQDEVDDIYDILENDIEVVNL